MKKTEIESLIKSTVDRKAKAKIENLKAQLKEAEQALDKVLDLAEDRGLATALYLQFVTKNNLMDEFKQFLQEQNRDLIH